MSNTSNDPVVLLIRHPESEANVHLHQHDSEIDQSKISDILAQYGDPDITLKGKYQAQKTSQYLANQYRQLDPRPQVIIHASNLRRTHLIANLFSDCLLELKCLFQQSKEKHIKNIKTKDKLTNDKDQNLDKSLFDSYNIPDILGPYFHTELQEYTRQEKKINREKFKIDQSPRDFIARVYRDFIKGFLFQNQTVENELNVFFGHSLYWGVTLTILFLINQNRDLALPENQEELINLLLDSSGTKINIMFEIPNCSITTLKYDRQKESWRILGVGKNNHLGSYLITGNHSVF